MPRKFQVLRKLHALYITQGVNFSAGWAQVIRSYLSHGFPMEALIVYTQNLTCRTQQSFLPLILKICGSHSLLLLGESLHSESIKAGTVHELLTGTTFVSMYGKCKKVALARKFFDEMPVKNLVTYNSMIGGYCMNGDLVSASALFHLTPGRTPVTWAVMIEGYAGIENLAAARKIFNSTPPWMKTVVTWTVMINGYAANGEMDAARELFEEMPVKNAYVWSSMITGCFKKGNACEAKALFDRIQAPNLINWNALIAGYAKIGFCEEALGAFRQMQESGIGPDEFTVSCILSACAQLGSLDSAMEVHEFIRRRKIKMNCFVLNGLVDMYAKCGDLDKARRIFNTMIIRNDSCWNSMISGLASHGWSEEALELFSLMEASEVKPNSITFLVVLSACTHGGFVEQGLQIFRSMHKYGLKAGVEHYGCLVDLFSRAGRLGEAYNVIKIMPMKPNEVVWGTLLGACRVYSDMEMADQVVLEANNTNISISSVNDADYVLLSNIFAAAENWEKAEKMRRKMVENKLTKTPGCSSIGLGESKQHCDIYWNGQMVTKTLLSY
ncbi:pentatricopeptide repeat-containing protein At3g21470 [Phalaenopsis equestris]|uniref:pentatricopeptide repeat-containing protein At3g21470 n=1 Tax=Phalaenopsis equestris TaxID=78828 RepID=UPI0009E1D512|nr:pentatricopeptide repeat-containing protein At3g21470 [Phalaenopsis equestris]